MSTATIRRSGAAETRALHRSRACDSARAVTVSVMRARTAVDHALLALWGWGAVGLVSVSTVVAAALAIIGILVTRRPWPGDVVGAVWGRFVVKVCGIRIEIEGTEHIDPRRAYVLIANHLSNLDVIATLAAVPLPIHFVAKQELLRVPVFGRALRMSNHIVIDRSKPDEAIARINERVAGQLGNAFGILFFGEGTRSPDGKVHVFKKGGVTLALHTGLPIIPVSISGTRKFLPKGSLRIHPGGRVKIVLGALIETRGRSVEEREALNEQVRIRVVAGYIEDY
jgi:1-acyl-sn-glycerol-3-phosphate acyltransferase